jgi:threonine/homoserine/homoserine lactone efflux protein
MEEGMKLLKGICISVICACLVWIVITVLAFTADTITLKVALKMIVIIMILVLCALGAYLAIADEIIKPHK